MKRSRLEEAEGSLELCEAELAGARYRLDIAQTALETLAGVVDDEREAFDAEKRELAGQVASLQARVDRMPESAIAWLEAIHHLIHAIEGLDPNMPPPVGTVVDHETYRQVTFTMAELRGLGLEHAQVAADPVRGLLLVGLKFTAARTIDGKPLEPGRVLLDFGGGE